MAGQGATGGDRLTAAVRAAAEPRTWSRGVMLAREGAVEGVEETDDEIVFSVRTRDRPVPPTVVLYPDTGEWDCDCGGRLDVCPHVVAAVLALAASRKDGGALPESKRPKSSVRYRFRRQGNLLELERLEVGPDGAVRRLTEPVRQAAGRRTDGAELVLTEADISLDRFLPKGVSLIEHREQARAIFEHLAGAPDVWLEEASVTAEAELALPEGRVFQKGQTYRLRIQAGADVEEVVAPDIVRLRGSRLRLLGEVGLVGSRLQKLPIEKTYQLSERAVLTHEVLPIYEGRFPIHVEISVHKGRGKGKPRLQFDVHLAERSVTVGASLVYGDPATLRIQDGRPVSLGGPAPQRDFEAEYRLIEHLRDELNMLVDRPTTVAGPEGAAFLQKVRSFEATRGRGFVEEELPVASPRLDMEAEGRFHLSFEADGEEGGAAEAGAALTAYESGQTLVPLAGGGWARLDRTWWAEHADEVALLLQLRDKEGRVAPSGWPALGALAQALDQPPPPGLERLAPLFEDFEGLPTAALPEDLRADLRPYQRVGVDWLSFLREAGLGALLADDMGLGKTLQTIAVLRPRALVVSPTSVLNNWAREIERFRPGLSVHIHHGARRSMDRKADVVLTTYALLRADRGVLEGERWGVMVLDEAQAIKNPDSLTARAAFSIPADFRIALTGTPVENRLEELWSQIHFSNPGLLGGRADFDGRFVKPIESGSLEAQTKLRNRTRPVVLRRLKRDVARELPPRTDMVLTVDLDEQERAAYDGIRVATQKEVVQRLKEGASVLAALEALLRLRQAACHTGLLPGRSACGSSKLDVLLEVLDEAVSEGHKALVFSQWTGFLDLTEPELERAGLAFTRLDGSTADRSAVVDRFQRPDGPPVMLLSLKAGGVGLNLTAADHVFLLDPWWNPAAEDQAADRAHRIGQDRPVMVHRLVARDTVEERILALQEKKRLLAEAALGEAAGAARMTRDDLLALLE